MREHQTITNSLIFQVIVVSWETWQRQNRKWSLERHSCLSCFSVSLKKQQVLVWYFQDLFGDLCSSSVGSGRQETVGQPADQGLSEAPPQEEWRDSKLRPKHWVWRQEIHPQGDLHPLWHGLWQQHIKREVRQRGRRPSAAGRERLVTASTGSSRSDFRQSQFRLSHRQVFFACFFLLLRVQKFFKNESTRLGEHCHRTKKKKNYFHHFFFLVGFLKGERNEQSFHLLIRTQNKSIEKSNLIKTNKTK